MGDAIEYKIEASPTANGSSISRRFSIENWQSGPEDIWRLANAFTGGEQLANARFNFDIPGYGSHYKGHLFEGPDWLRVVLFANPKRRVLIAYMFIQDQIDLEKFDGFFWRASIDEACVFGTDLLREIKDSSPEWWKENKESENS